MKVPFPIKVLLSYIAVLAIGAIPMWIFLMTSFSDDLINHRYEEMILHNDRLSQSLAEVAPEKRIRFAQTIANTSIEDIALIRDDGRLLYDSMPIKNPKKFVRGTEVGQALGKQKGPYPGVGVSKGIASNGKEMLYVAQQIPGSNQLVRLAYPSEPLKTFTDHLVQVFRNALALAITLAGFFSLLASFLFLKPLRRLVRSANALADGQFDATERWKKNDEIGDVGKALNSLALKLRKKLAGAHAAEAIMTQVIENVESCVAVFNNHDELVASSGIFHERLNGDFDETMRKWLSSKSWKKAKKEAEKLAEGVPLKWTKKYIPEDLELHQLELSNSDPFWMISTYYNINSIVPEPEDCEILSISNLVKKLKKVQSFEADINFDSELEVVDTAERIVLVFTIVLKSINKIDLLSFEKHATKVSVKIDALLDAQNLQLCRDLLRPIDSEVKIDNDTTLIWLRRA